MQLEGGRLQGRGHHQKRENGTLLIAFQPQAGEENKFRVLSYPFYGILLQQLKQTNTAFFLMEAKLPGLEGKSLLSPLFLSPSFVYAPFVGVAYYSPRRSSQEPQTDGPWLEHQPQSCFVGLACFLKPENLQKSRWSLHKHTAPCCNCPSL